MEINGKTRLIGLMGNPVEHTLSPMIHNEMSERMGISSVYVPFKVEEQGVTAAVRGAYELNILGMNVTVPYKNSVMGCLPVLDEAARQIGAVNTLVRMEELGGYKGYNTDMMGLRRQIQEDGISLQGETVVVLGAGGAARAVVYMCLLEETKKIYLLNRTITKAEQIAADMNRIAEQTISFTKNSKEDREQDGKQAVIPMALSDYSSILEENLIVFQATSIGLSPNIDHAILEDTKFYKKIRVGVDLIYNPANTKFMQMITANGGQAYNALKMLLYQGVIAYELWHNKKIPQDIIQDVYAALKRNVYSKDNIVLIGFMGSGKTTVGLRLARELDMDFIDTDAYIEEQAGKKISEIFNEDGEDTFRNLETEVLMNFRNTVKNTVFSTGGGMPLKKENASLLKEIGTVFYLTASNQVIYDRVKNSVNRPLLQRENSYETICELMRERTPSYESVADIVVNTNSNHFKEVVEDIKKELKL